MNQQQNVEGTSMQATSIEEAVMHALRSSDVRIRAGGIASASRSIDPEALVEAVADPSDAVRRNAAIEALTRAGPRSVPTLIRALHHRDVEVVMFAAGILGKTRDATAIPHLVRLLDHEDVNVAQGAIESLAQLRAAPSVDALIKMLDRDLWLRFSAIHALGAIGDPRAVGPLKALLQGEDDGLGDAVVPALGRIGSRDALRVPLRASSSGAAATRSASRSASARSGPPLQQEPDGTAVLARIEAWSKLGTADASEVHLRLLKVLSADAGQIVAGADELELKAAALEMIRALRLKPLYGALVGAARDPLLREPLQFCILSLGAEMALRARASGS